MEGAKEAALVVVKEYLSLFLLLKLFLQKQRSIQPAIMLKAFPWKTIAVLKEKKKIYMRSQGCNELPQGTCLGLGVVICKWF